MGAWNPLTFPRKQRAAYNAMIGAYTFTHLHPEAQERVVFKLDEIIQRDFPHTSFDKLKDGPQIIFVNFLVYAMNELGIKPALGDLPWYYVKRPFIDCIGAEEVADLLHPSMESKFGVKLERF